MKRILSVIMAILLLASLPVLAASATEATDGQWRGILRIIDDQLPEYFPKAEYNDDGVRFIPPEGLTHFMGGLLYDKPVSLEDMSVEIRVDQLLPKENMMDKWIGIGIMDKPVLNPKSPDQGSGVFLLFFINATGVVTANAYLYLGNNEAGVPETITVNAGIYDGGTIRFSMKQSADGYTLTVNDKSFKYPFAELKQAYPDGMGNVTVAAYSYTDYSKSDFTIVNFNGKNPSTGANAPEATTPNATDAPEETVATAVPQETESTEPSQTAAATEPSGGDGDGGNQNLVPIIILVVALVVIAGVVVVLFLQKKKPEEKKQ